MPYEFKYFDEIEATPLVPELPRVKAYEIVFSNLGEIKEGDEVVVNGGRKAVVVRDQDGSLAARFPEVDGDPPDPSITVVRLP